MDIDTTNNDTMGTRDVDLNMQVLSSQVLCVWCRIIVWIEKVD
jgi:hypothetical protein